MGAIFVAIFIEKLYFSSWDEIANHSQLPVFSTLVRYNILTLGYHVAMLGLLCDNHCFELLF